MYLYIAHLHIHSLNISSVWTEIVYLNLLGFQTTIPAAKLNVVNRLPSDPSTPLTAPEQHTGCQNWTKQHYNYDTWVIRPCLFGDWSRFCHCSHHRRTTDWCQVRPNCSAFCWQEVQPEFVWKLSPWRNSDVLQHSTCSARERKSSWMQPWATSVTVRIHQSNPCNDRVTRDKLITGSHDFEGLHVSNRGCYSYYPSVFVWGMLHSEMSHTSREVKIHKCV